MTDRRRRTKTALMLMLVVAPLCVPSAAEAQPTRHALLIGVGKFSAKAIRPLEGPRLDAEALRQELVANWGFAGARVNALVDEQATRANILGALDQLISASRPGDFVLIYFSGHGTSRQDRRQMHYNLHPATGAIFPYDTLVASEDQTYDSLIVGRRDLRSRFDRLDKDRQVLVIIDSCYSRNVTRSAALLRGTPKSNELFGPLEGFSNTATAEPYPYRNLITLTAASEAEEAQDIGSELLKRGVQTIDGRPKGALTDALLRGLRGDANTNNDKVLTLNELFQYSRERVKRTFPHTPQLILPDGREDMASQPLFDGAVAPARRIEEISQVLRVQTEGLAPPLLRKIEALPGIAVTAAGGFDVRIASDRSKQIVLYHESGDVLQSFQAGDDGGLLQRLQRERYARYLIELQLPKQAFNVRADIPSPTGVLQAGKKHLYTFICRTDLPSALLVLNVDRDGIVNVLVPNSAAELTARPDWKIPGITVSPPEGTEFVKVFAFVTTPPWLSQWATKGFRKLPADSPQVRDLLSTITAMTGVAEARLKVVTVPERIQ